MAQAQYIHGTHGAEQQRLAGLNRLTNGPFVEFLRLRPTDRVLEVGSGLGMLADEVSRRVPEGECVALEYAVEQLQAARASFPHLRMARGDAHALPFGDRRFDVVYCRYLLEHVGDPLGVLREMRRVLVDGGRAVAQENNILVNVFDPPCPRFDEVWGKFAALQRRLGGDALVGRRLLGLFQQAGFADVVLSIQPEVHWSGRPTFRPWVENLLNNVLGAAEPLERHGLAGADDLRRVEAEVRQFMARDDAAAIFYWNRAEGRRAAEG